LYVTEQFLQGEVFVRLKNGGPVKLSGIRRNQHLVSVHDENSLELRNVPSDRIQGGFGATQIESFRMFRTVPQQLRCFVYRLCYTGVQDTVLKTLFSQTISFVLLPVREVLRTNSVAVEIALPRYCACWDIQIENVAVHGCICCCEDIDHLVAFIEEHVMPGNERGLASPDSCFLDRGDGLFTPICLVCRNHGLESCKATWNKVGDDLQAFVEDEFDLAKLSFQVVE